MGRGGMVALRGPTMRLEIAGLRFGNSHGSRPGLSRVIFYNEVNGHTEGKLSPGGVDLQILFDIMPGFDEFGSGSLEFGKLLEDEDLKKGMILTCQALPTSEKLEIVFE